MPKLSDSLLNSGILFYSRVFSLFYWNHAAKLAGLHFDLRFSKIIFHAFQAVFFCCWWFEKFSFQTKTFLLQKLAKYHPFGFRLKPYFLLLAMAESEFFLLMSFLLELLLFFQLLIFIFCRLGLDRRIIVDGKWAPAEIFALLNSFNINIKIIIQFFSTGHRNICHH